MTDTETPPSDITRPVPHGGRSMRVIHGLGWTLIYLGVLTLGFVVHELVITTWFAQQAQPELTAERLAQWAQTDITDMVVVPTTTANQGNENTTGTGAPGDEGGSAQPVILKVESEPELGTAFAVIRIPKLERLRDGWNVVEGVRVVDLRNGAGHMPGTAMPGQPGNAVISGHRTTYGQPFHELNELDPGDRIEVETAIGTSVYEVREIHIVAPTDLWVTEPRQGAWLTLTTCHPKFSARQRYVVVAELVYGPNYDAIQAMS
ncbi:MAG: class E sortase [Acidimicrobiia bacterium]